MTKLRKLSLLLLSAVTFMMLIFAAAVSIPARAEGKWTLNGGATSSEVNGETVYSTTSALGFVEYKGGDFSNINTISAQFNYKGNANFNLEYAGFQINSGSDYYIFGIWPNSASNGPVVALIQKNTSDPFYKITDSARAELDSSVCGKNVWYTLKVVFDDNYLAMYVNDTCIMTSESIGANIGAISWTRALAVTDGNPAQIKGLTLSHTPLEMKEGWSASSNVVQKGEGENAVYTTDTAISTVSYIGDVSSYNTISATVSYTGATISDHEYVGLQIYGNNTYYLFSVWPNTPSNGPAVAFVQKGTDDPISRLSRTELAAKDFGKQVEFRMKVVMTDNYFRYYLNDTLIVSSDDVDDNIGKYTWTGVRLLVSHCPATVKNLAISYTDLAAEEGAVGWKGNSNVTVEGTEDAPVYRTNSATGIVEYKNGDLTTVNTVEGTFRYQGDASSNYEYVGFKIYTGEDFYTFAVWPNTAAEDQTAVCLIQKNTEDPINRYVRLTLPKDTFNSKTEYTMKVVLTNEYFALYFNGELMANSFGVDIELGEAVWSRVMAISKGCPSEIKNLLLSWEEPDYSTYCEFTYEDEKSVEAMSGENVALSWSDGALKATLTDGEAYVQSPEISVTPGHKYSVKLSVRNTFVVRMKNDSSADKLTLSYTMKTDGVFDGEKQKTFAIEPNSGWKTYYFNISDTVNCRHWIQTNDLFQCNHYLKQFRFAFSGASQGDVYIDEISFAREDRIYPYAAESITAIANKEAQTVTVSGTLLPEYANQTVTLIHTSVMNFNQLIDWPSNQVLASVQANGTQFSITIPLKQKGSEMTHLSTKMMAVVSEGDYKFGVKLSKVFMVENWRDFCENPYEFTLPSLTVSVTDEQFGAKGDGFTNDTAAIQAAIDYVSAQGGGKVVVPGDVSNPFGNRYIMTGVQLKDNVELHVEEGAVLWQSNRIEDYTKYEVYIGHENMGENVAWGLSALMHLPFIYIRDVENVRVTGGGTIRMDDTGTEWLDGWGYTWDSNITVGCSSVVHLVPIGIYGSKNVEISDLNVIRSSCWHAYIRESSNVFFGNVDLSEVNCINGDGFDFSTAVYNVLVERCSLYSNDDALVLAVTTNDPRDDLSIWRDKSQKKDKSLHDFVVRHCNLFGGHGITFIPWASEASDFSTVEIYNIDVQDCDLGGFCGDGVGVGAWADNPFYGKSNYWLGTYGLTDAVEDGDYSPIRNVTILNNLYGFCSFYGINVTNVITDAPLLGATQFENGNFDKVVHDGKGFDDESNYVMGTAYWTGKGDFGTEAVGKKQSVKVGSGAVFVQDDYAGYVKGNGELAQGIYLTFGSYTVKMDICLQSGEGTLFARNAETGELIASQALTATEDFASVSMNFVIEKSVTVQIGVSHTGADEDIVYLDNAVVLEDTSYDKYQISGKEFTPAFDTDFALYSVGGNASTDGKSYVIGDDTEYKVILKNEGLLDEFEVSVDIYLFKDANVNAGIYVFASKVGTGQDDIDAYNVQIETNILTEKYCVKIFNFENVYLGTLATSEYFDLQEGVVTLRVVVKQNCIFVFLNEQKTPVLTQAVERGLSGNVGLRSQAASAIFENFYLKTAQFIRSGVNRAELYALLEQVNGLDRTRYTQASYEELMTTVDEIYEIMNYVDQREINKAESRLSYALSALVLTPYEQAKEDLSKLISGAKDYLREDYTQESYGAFESALESAKAVYADEAATEEQIRNACAQLSSAIDGLQEPTAEPKPPVEPDIEPNEPSSGCGSVAFGGAGVAIVLLGALFVTRKKK